MAGTTTQPDRIARYRILTELGRGAMGRVFLAEDPRIGRRIALKVLAQHDGLNENKKKELLRRFLSEARAAGCLNHPGIVTVFDADSDPVSGAPYLAMEWVNGRTLSRILKEEGALPIPRVIDLVSQVAAALDHAHHQNVVHRDVKPANLLVTAGGAVKVTDFGIAKLRSQSLTMTGQMIGTPFYMAPEQITGDPVDGRADLFALGVVLYECLTGKVAFEGDTLANITHKILRVHPRPAVSLNSAIPKRLNEVIDRALAKQAEDRFQTGAELEQQLRAVAEDLDGQRAGRANAESDAPPAEHPLDGSTVSLTPPPVAAPPTVIAERTARRPRAGVLRRIAGLAALLFLLPLLATLTLRTIQEQHPEWLADAPEWMSESPPWMDQTLGRMSGLSAWMNDVADRLSEVPGRISGNEDSDPSPIAQPVTALPEPAGPPPAPPAVGKETSSSPRNPPITLGPVAPLQPIQSGFVTLEDLLTAPASPPDFVMRHDGFVRQN